MANKVFCPIMTIGFEPPKKGQRDNRICMKDCAWYNLSEDKCNINVITEHLEMIESLTDDMSYMVSGYAEMEKDYEDFGSDEITGYYNRATGKRT